MLLDAPYAAGRSQTSEAIDRAERLLTGHLRPRGKAAAAVAEAATSARALMSAGEPCPSDLGDVCLVELLASSLCEVCLEIVDPCELRALLDSAAEHAGESSVRFRLEVARGALSGVRLVALRDDVAAAAVLTMVAALIPVETLSLWEREATGGVRLVQRIGEAPAHALQTRALEALAGKDAGLAFLVAAGEGRPSAVLLAETEAAPQPWIAVVLSHAAAALGAVLERRSLLDQSAAQGTAIAKAYERRLGRLALDIHDGPLQNVAGIAGDLKLLRHRVETANGSAPDPSRLLGCVADLQARVEGIDTELRDLSHVLESPAIAHRPVAVSLRAEAEAFRRRSDIALSLELQGELDDLTCSQRIALIRIVQESLSNAREHSRAQSVRLTVRGGRDRLTAEVVDDGCGFDVAATLLDAGRRGRFGLVSVSERARLLGGTCEIQSRPGGPTKLSLDLPRWRPGAPAGEPEPPAQG